MNWEKDTNDENNIFSYKMVVREVLINAISEGEFTEVKDLDSAHKIWTRLEALYEGHKFTKQAKFQNWETRMEKLQMKDDENIRDYVQRVTEVVIGIENFGGTYEEEEVIAKILRSLTPIYKTKV